MASGQRSVARGTARERAVRRLVAAGERDGLTVRKTAERAGMPAGTLAWWRSEIRRRDALRRRTEEGPVFVEVVARPQAVEPVREATIATRDQAAAPETAAAAAPFEILLRGGRVLRVAAGYGLSRLVREIEGC